MVASAAICCSAIYAMRVGKVVAWDQKNYHYYNVYAWLTGRMGFDVAPAGMHSFLNPIAYIPQYFMIRHFSPISVGMTNGAVQALNFVLIYGASRIVFENSSRWLAIGIALICGVVGFLDPLLSAEIGTSYSDYVVSLPVLAALCALCWAINPGCNEKQRGAAYGLSGILLGAAAGLKLTCLVYAIGMTLTLVVLWPMVGTKLRHAVIYAAGGIVGFLPTGGVWSWILWTRYKNPFLPYWNNLFRSPWMVASDFRDRRFLPDTIADAISYPFQWFVGLHPTTEGNMRDARFALLAVLMAMVLACLIWAVVAWLLRLGHNIRNPGAMASREAMWLVLVFATISYVIWAGLYSFQRYLAPVALLSGLLLILALDFLISDKSNKIAAFVLLAIFCCCWMKPETSFERVPYGSDWFGVRLPKEAQFPGTLFIMLGGGPMGYVVPSLPPSSRTVRLIDSTIPENGTETQIVRTARRIIARHVGPIRSLSMDPLGQTEFDYLRRFGLEMDEKSCREFRSDVDRFTTCALAKAACPNPAR